MTSVKQNNIDILEDKALGCMIGGAVGDALGYAVEFYSYDKILSKYGPGGIRRYELNSQGVAEISDDTQMSLYTASGLLIDDMKAAYVEWLNTQSDAPMMPSNPKCWLSRIPAMYTRRAPGMTCISSLIRIANGKEASNDSKGCGGIMRVAPIGIFYTPLYFQEYTKDGLSFDKTARVACEAARLTHMHPMGYLSAGLLAATVQMILEKTQINIIDNDCAEIDKSEFLHCIHSALHAIRYLCCCTHDYDADMESEELIRQTNHAIDLANSDIPDVEAINELGEGWVGEEAWYIAVFCSVRHFDSFEDAVVAAVNHNGDSDSAGAITGNIMGAIHGYNAIPDYYKQNLELHDIILKMTHEIFRKQTIHKTKV